ncbi:MAG TPA: acyl-CoA dehydrogenase family protein [Candidatus Saccharimonadales bacterium]|nr:acyl-CoA dehydrogenase family protein [Candidatus Saccharimonadales bacterium]
MDLRYRDDQLAVRDAVREFVRDRIVPRAAEWSEQGAFPMPLLPELASVGLTGLTIPAEYGGSGVDALTSALVSEELGAGDGSIALTLAAHNALCIGHLLVAASAEQKGRWLPPLAKGAHLGAWALTEPSAGSDAVNAKTTAKKDGDGWVLNGQKQFITNGSIAGFTVVIAATADRRLTAFGVSADNPGLVAGKREKKMGLGASDTAQLSLQDCRVPDADRIGEIGAAFGDVRKVLDRGRIGIGALAVGLGRAALETAVGYAKERKQFGKALAEFQMIQWRLAQARTDLDAGRLLVQRAASLADAGLPFTRAASMAKLYATEAASRAANASLQVLGGYGYLRDYPVERIVRDVRLMEIGEGTSEIQRIVIARDLVAAS